MRTLPLIIVAALVAGPVAAVNAEYSRKLERSGCTQVTEMQGCDINKTKAENARAGFGTPAPAAAPAHRAPAPTPFKDAVGKSSSDGMDLLMSRGFTNVDTISEGNSLYGIYYKRDTRQCIQLAMVVGGTVQSANDIQTHPKCR